MNPWSNRPGKKIPILRFTLESWAQHMADPAKYASMLREHARSIRNQLKLLDKRRRCDSENLPRNLSRPTNNNQPITRKTYRTPQQRHHQSTTLATTKTLRIPRHQPASLQPIHCYLVATTSLHARCVDAGGVARVGYAIRSSREASMEQDSSRWRLIGVQHDNLCLPTDRFRLSTEGDPDRRIDRKNTRRIGHSFHLGNLGQRRIRTKRHLLACCPLTTCDVLPPNYRYSWKFGFRWHMSSKRCSNLYSSALSDCAQLWRVAPFPSVRPIRSRLHRQRDLRKKVLITETKVASIDAWASPFRPAVDQIRSADANEA